MKYCVTLQTRSIPECQPYPDLRSVYHECDTIRDLNDWIFHHVCNSSESKQIINFYFEVIG